MKIKVIYILFYSQHSPDITNLWESRRGDITETEKGSTGEMLLRKNEWNRGGGKQMRVVERENQMH